jgi:hypothetical protein
MFADLVQQDLKMYNMTSLSFLADDSVQSTTTSITGTQYVHEGQILIFDLHCS